MSKNLEKRIMRILMLLCIPVAFITSAYLLYNNNKIMLFVATEIYLNDAMSPLGIFSSVILILLCNFFNMAFFILAWLFYFSYRGFHFNNNPSKEKICIALGRACIKIHNPNLLMFENHFNPLYRSLVSEKIYNKKIYFSYMTMMRASFIIRKQFNLSWKEAYSTCFVKGFFEIKPQSAHEVMQALHLSKHGLKN